MQIYIFFLYLQAKYPFYFAKCRFSRSIMAVAMCLCDCWLGNESQNMIEISEAVMFFQRKCLPLYKSFLCLTLITLLSKI